MIIYGWKGKLIKKAPLENHICQHCNEKNSQLLVYANYVHIFWVPLFPFKKKSAIHCAHCQQVTEEKSLQKEQREQLKLIKKSVPIPKYLFIGLVLIAAVIIAFTISGQQSKNEEMAVLSNPEVGDVYKLYDETEKTAYKYYLWKIADMAGDSLYVSPCSFSYDGLPVKLDPEDGFYNVAYGIHKDEVKLMYDKGEVIEISRNYGEETGFMQVLEFPAENNTK